MPSAIYGVVIADVLASSARKDVRALLGKKLTAASEKHLREKRIRLPYSVTAGDEFQTLTEQLPSLPALLLDLRAGLQPLSLRVGIGIGEVSDRIQPPVNHRTGEAFQLARVAHQSCLRLARYSGVSDHGETVGGHRPLPGRASARANRQEAQG